MKFEESFVEAQRGFARGTLKESHRPTTARTVTLGFLSKDIPASAISGALAKSLVAETGASVVVLRLQNAEPGSLRASFGDQATVVDWASCESVLQGQFLPGSLIRTEAGYYLLNLTLNGSWSSPEGITSLWNQLNRYYRYVLMEFTADGIPDALTLEFLARSDVAYLFLRRKAEDVLHLERVIAEVCARDHNDTGRLKPFFCSAEVESAETFRMPRQSMFMPNRLLRDWLPDDSQRWSNRFNADMRRLAREIGGRLVGLALSSGAAKGFAHIGVIQVLEENGIEVDVVAGASMGAYVGALWAHGCDGCELERLSRELEGAWTFWTLID